MFDACVDYKELEDIISDRFTVTNYLVKKSSHEKVLLSDDKGHQLVRTTIFKPADIEVYKILQNINSENVCSIYEIAEADDAYIIYEEFCEGVTLEDLDHNMGEREAVDIVMNICKGLYALHQCSIVHRDLKPENIIITDDNTIKIIDFDSARLYKKSNDGDTTVLGTIGYAAPEQFGFLQSDNRTDLYSLCVILNMLITGVHPSVKMCENKHIKKILQKCLSINPSERYNDANELNTALAKARRWCK